MEANSGRFGWLLKRRRFTSSTPKRRGPAWRTLHTVSVYFVPGIHLRTSFANYLSIVFDGKPSNQKADFDEEHETSHMEETSTRD